jgi:hypothetical protein
MAAIEVSAILRRRVNGSIDCGMLSKLTSDAMVQINSRMG